MDRTDLKVCVLRHMSDRYAPLLAFWTGQGPLPQSTRIEAHCDLVYTLVLLGEEATVPSAALKALVEALRGYSLPGLAPHAGLPVLSVHNLAYACGVLNLFPARKTALYSRLAEGRSFAPDTIVDPASHLPIFPPKWAHHNWRVSHWIGGIPSILLSLSRSGLPFADQAAQRLAITRDASDRLVAPQTGLLRAWRSDAVQWLFRRLYAFRHDPDLGDLGGVAHLLWIDHVIGRRYVGLEALHAQASHLFRKHGPFMEAVPYCLDFDIVQILRTAAGQLGRTDPADRTRAAGMMAAIEAFFAAPIPEGYTLHKVPGALATWHECALMTDTPTGPDHTNPPTDIIREAFWL
ncbi:MAG: hypothetical protein INF93_00390 [Rhodobacter sp.]|nr:hypothetical protein [Rhodobacter sp.]